MTPGLVRAFRLHRCDPTLCHCCRERIHIGDYFQLAFNEDSDKDEMLCDGCTMLDLRQEQARQLEERKNLKGGGFTRRHNYRTQVIK